MPRPALRPATASDLPAVHRLLAEAGLPLDGFHDHAANTLVWDAGPAIAGAITFERYGEAGLLRSLVVDRAHRGTGLGAALLEAGLQKMRDAGVRHAYGLTTTIPEWLGRLGWQEIRKADIPAPVHASLELRGACPDTARVFRTTLA